MSEATKDQQQKMVIPICAHCNAELASLGLFNWSVGPAVILCLYCPECKKALHFESAAIAPAPPQRPSILS